MEIISEKIDGKIEAVLYDDDGKEMMVLPKVKNSRGKEIGIDIHESILHTMEKQDLGKEVTNHELKDAERKVLNYKLFGAWHNPEDLEWILQTPSREIVTEEDLRPVSKLYKWIDKNN